MRIQYANEIDDMRDGKLELQRDLDRERYWKKRI